MARAASQRHRPSRRSTVAVVRALALSCHPIPSLAVTALTAGLAVQAGTTLVRGVLVSVAMLAGQLSIGWCNDAVDADRDRYVNRTDKPVAAGLVATRTVAATAVLALLAAVAVSLPLGGRAAIVIAASLACGWAYNLGLKATAWSWLPYALAFGALPAIATLASTEPRWPAAWTIVAGALFGIAAHLANALPDLLDDQVTGVRGLPHRLGARMTAVGGPLILLAASVVIFVGLSGHAVAPRLAGLGAALVVAAWAMRSALADPGSRRYFFAVIAIAMLDVLSFAVSGAKI